MHIHMHMHIHLHIQVWAICCGRLALAFLFWEFTAGPLRAALIGQQLCHAIRTVHGQRIPSGITSQIEAGEAGFAKRAAGVLSQLESQTMARRIFYPEQQMRHQYGTIGQVSISGVLRLACFTPWGRTAVHQRTMLELINIFNNVEVASHPYIEGVVDELWLVHMHARAVCMHARAICMHAPYACTRHMHAHAICSRRR